jgi:hypothetical protein
MKPNARAGGPAFAALTLDERRGLSPPCDRPAGVNPAARSCAPIAVFAVAAALAVATPAQAQDDAQSFLQGTHVFRFALGPHEGKFTPLNSLKDLSTDPKQSILVVFGDTRILDAVPNGPRDFLRRGGAILAATDRRTILTGLGIHIQSQPVLAPPGSKHAYHGYPECPIVVSVDDEGPPLFENLGHGVATNRAGLIDRWDSRLHVLADFPEGCKWQGNIFSEPFAVGGDWRAGRIVVLADHSVFINNMMLQEDNGNYDFARNCMAWLSDNRRRTKVLFVDEGTIVADFDVPLSDRMPAFPEIKDPVGFVDELMPALEKHNFFNQKLMEYVSPNSVFQALAIVLTLGLLVYGVSRLVRARHRIELAAPLLAQTLTALVPAGPGVADRHKALLAEGNLWEPAHALAREFFELALSGRATTASLPPFKVNAKWPRVRALRQQVERLWRLVKGSPVWISPAEFTRITADVAKLKTALADGTLTWQL